MSDIKIILLCSSRFALPALREFAFFNFLAAVAIPRTHEEWKAQVHHTLTGLNIPVIELDEIGYEAQLIEAMGIYQVNLGLMMTFPYKIPGSVFELPAKGFYNVHPGPLPRYRGADPVFQQLRRQEKYAGVTIHILDEGFDTGELVMIERIKIESTDSYGMLTTKLANLACTLTGFLVRLAAMDKVIASRPQKESDAMYYPRQGPADILINWQTMNAGEIAALIRACNPWNKGAVTQINNQVIRLLEAEPLNENDFPTKEPGIVLHIDDEGLLVSTLQEGSLWVKLVSADEGFFRAEYLQHLGVSVGDKFN